MFVKVFFIYSFIICGSTTSIMQLKMSLKANRRRIKNKILDFIGNLCYANNQVRGDAF